MNLYDTENQALSLPSVLRNTGKCILLLFAVTLAGFLFFHLGFTEANIITIYILGVLVISVVTSSWIYSLISSLVSVLVFNFFFTAPHFTFQAYDQGYPVTFLVMFLAAFITGSLASRLKNQARQSAQSEYRTRVLFETSQLLQQARGGQEIMAAAASQLVKLLERDVVFYLSDGEKLGEPQFFPADDRGPAPCSQSDNEKAVAAWVFQHNHQAGAATDTLSSASCLYLAIRTSQHIHGVAGIVMGEEPLDSFERSVLLSILAESALALENDRNAREKETAAILAEHEQLRANLDTFETDRPLSEAEKAALLDVAAGMVREQVLPCTACRYCVDHCPRHLDIPGLLALYNEHTFTGGGFIAPMAVEALPEEKRPAACIGCRSCEAVCPQQLKISEALADFARKLG